MASEIPLVDISPFLSPQEGADTVVSLAGLAAREQTVKNLYAAFSTWGFCLLKGHGISSELRSALYQTTEDFFSLPIEKKLELHVKNGGVAWRGYMPRGGEATHGHMDHKEGIYFGPEHPENHPHAGLPLHGKNQFPDHSVPAMRPTILAYIEHILKIGTILSDIISISLGLSEGFMREEYLSPEPISIVRCFKYVAPDNQPEGKPAWGIGEHTDFGYLTLLNQGGPGLQIVSPSQEWIDVPFEPDLLVCNVGDMLDRMTNGRFKSIPHRVKPPAPGMHRISFPFFFDFSWDAKMKPLPLSHLQPISEEEQSEAFTRWEGTTFTGISGTWAQYLAKKVKKVFPELVLGDFEHNAKPSTRFTVAVQV